uniref:Uncharacterized protein n=1 Tax=Setaria digitata TaxID=48799 RepID=A0A915PUX1_9BILA
MIKTVLEIDGKPSPEVIWLDTNNQPITAKSDRFNIKTVGRLTTLTILGIDANLQGKYMLKIKNELGEAKCEIPVQILEQLLIPNRPILEKQTFNSVKLKWDAVSDIVATGEVQYIVEMKKDGDDKWVKAIESDQLNVVVEELKPNNAYLFRIRIKTKDTISEPSEESEPLFIDDKKELESVTNEQVKKKLKDEKINYDELFTDVKSSDYRNIDIKQLPSDFESKYILCEKIGIGDCSTVYRAIERATGKNWAAKMINICPRVKREMVMHEIGIMNEVHHEKLLNLHEVFDLGNEICLIEEFISGGELYDQIIKDNALMSEDEACNFIRQILQGVQCMHRSNIVHLDLKPDNILLTTNQSNNIKIIDFGLAQKLYTDKKATLVFCSAEFCPPEVINAELVGLSADMWAIGVITYLLLSGSSPFAGKTVQETMANVSSGDWNFSDTVWNEVSDIAKDFVGKLIVKNKHERMTVDEALSHPWIVGKKLKTKKREKIPLAKKKALLTRKRLSDVLVPIGKLAKTSAIFRDQSTDDAFENAITFEANIPPRFLKNMEDTIAIVGDPSASLTCNIEALPRSVVIQWFKDDQEIQMIDTGRYEARYEHGTAELKIKNIVDSDAGRYSIIATNELGSIRSEAKLSVQRRNEEERIKADERIPEKVRRKKVTKAKAELEFNPKLTDMKVKAGSSIVLTVAITSHPELKIQWFRNDVAIDFNNSRFIITDDDNGYHNLQIISCDISDSTKWKAIARSDNEQCESVCNITVEIPNDFKAPVFTKNLTDINCNEGTDALLETSVSGKPLPEIIWYFENCQLQEDEEEHYKIRYDNETNIHSFKINNVAAKDCGTYKCCAKNSVGIAETTCNLVITERDMQKHDLEGTDKKAPIFQIPLTNSNLSEGDKLSLSCTVNGVPNPVIKWFKDGKVLNDSDYEIKNENGVCKLTISAIKSNDSGIYKCIAENINGTSETECKVHVKSADETRQEIRDKKQTKSLTVIEEELKGPIIIRPLEDDIIYEGNQKQLEVTIEAYPKPVITWFRNGQILEESNHLEAYFDGHVASLKINEANIADHQGEYLCRVINKGGSAETRCNIIIEKEILPEDQMLRMPKFVEKMNDMRASNEGDTLLLKCKVIGKPEPEIRWLLNGEPVIQSDGIHIRTFDDGVCTLEITHVTSEFCGTYTAIAHNNYGDAHTNAVVSFENAALLYSFSCKIVEDLPMKMSKEPFFAIVPMQELIVEEGSVLNIACGIDGEPKPTVKWLKNHSIIMDDRNVTHDNITYQFTISSVAPNDDGIYTVEAENINGKISANTVVHVIPKQKAKTVKRKGDKIEPSSLISQPYATDITSSSLLLHWKLSDDKNETKITEYIIEQRRPDVQTWTEISRSMEMKLLISNLQSNTEYLFRVGSRNETDQIIAYSPISEAIITLSSGKKPTIISFPPPTLVLNEKEIIELDVKFDGEPIPLVKWYQDGVELTDGKKNITIITLPGKSSKLIIKKPEVNIHPGFYSCHIGNEAGETVCETRVIKETIDAAAPIDDDDKKNELPEGLPQIIVPLSNETITAGQQFTLSCKIRLLPKGVVSWFRNDERLAPAGRYEMYEQDGTYKLVCHNAQKSDNAKYRCVATNSIGIIQSACEVCVVEGTAPTAPKFELLLKDKTVLTGKDVKLECRVFGDPKPQIIWMKDGTQISTNRHQKVEFTKNGNCSLRIFNCTAEDTGFYLCKAFNTHGTESSQMMLTVAEVTGPDSHLVTAENKEMQYCKPRFTRVPGKIVEITEGSTIKLISRAIGQPQPLVKWFKDGKEITKVNRAYEILLTGEGESVLSISCVVAKTAGIFKCVAENSEGSTSAETQLIVHTLLHKQQQQQQQQQEQEDNKAPSFTTDLVDIGVAIGQPVTLKCCVKGIPEPQLKWIFINDAQQTSILRTTTDSAWSEYRQGDECEMKSESVVKTQQGTYQCIASNEYGRAMTQCYLLIGEPFDQPAGPPRFLKCMRDIWAPLGENVEFEVEVSGYPLPELTWYHLDEKVLEEKNIQILYITPTKCQLKIINLSVSHLGTYSVEASNVHGIVRTTASINVGKKRSEVVPPKFLDDSNKNLPSTVPEASVFEKELPTAGLQNGSHYRRMGRPDVKRKGAAPAFLIGLEDLEFREGDAAALAGTVAKKRRHRIHGRSGEKRLAQFVMALPNGETDTSSCSVEPNVEITTLEGIRASIAERNRNICRPKFMVKPKSKKEIVEHKSLRLKTAISANPVPTVRWDKAGVVLETGNKYSIYNDGDFYYLEVHHVSKIDEGFYNCSASNSEGFVTCTAEIEVIPTDGTRRLRKLPTAPSFIEVLPGKFKATTGDPVSVECSISGYPAPTIQWLRNGAVLVPEHDRYMISYDGETTTLKFISITASDAGKYICIATNQEGEAKTAMQLDVESRKLPPTGGTPPKFRADGRREAIKAMDGDKVVLLAELLEGSEPLTIRWIRNKMEIQDSSGFGYSRQDAKCFLTIADAFPEDAGVYTCEAINEFGTANCNVRLIITEDRTKSAYENPPVIINAPTNVSVEQGNDLTLSVIVRGYPEPAVVWTKNMVSIASGEKYQMTNNGEEFKLTIYNCTNDDSGTYELQAVNPCGTAKAITTVNITEITNFDAVMPRFTKLPISIQSTIGQKASLSCSFKGLSSTVTWFHGDKKLINGRHGIEITTTATTSTLSILQLTEEHLGEYLCTVRNEYGEDLAKAVIFLEGSSVALPLLSGK